MNSRPPRPDEYRFDARYGRLIRKTGIGTIPFALFHYQGELALQPQEVWFIAYILAHRWTSELPFPSLARMAAHAGLTKRALRNYKDSLVAKGLLHVVPRFRPDGGATSHGYDFSPLFEALDVLITRDVEQWTRRSPQMLDDDGGDGEDDTPGERLFPSLPPGSQAFPPPGEDTFPGPRKRLLSGRGKARSAAQGNAGSPQEIDTLTGSDQAQIPGRQSMGETEKDVSSMGPTRPEVPTRGSDGDAGPGPQRPPQADVAPERAYVNVRNGEKTGQRAPFPQLDALMDEIGAQLHDGPESAHGNRVRLARLWRESGMDEAAFRAAMAEAVRRTQGASARIRQRANSVDVFPGARNKVPYFLAVLENLLKEPGGAVSGAAAAPPRQRLAPAQTVAGPGHAELWQAVGAALQRRLRTNEWETWLSDGRVLAINGDELVVALPTALAAEWAARKWGALADAAAVEAAGRPLRVRFVVENSGLPEG